MSLRTGLPAGERDEHVLGLEIAVDDAERVRGLERLEDLHRVLARASAIGELALRGRAALESGSPSRSSMTMYASPVRRAVDVGHLDDVRAPDLRRDARLLQEALDEARSAARGPAWRTLMATRVPSTSWLRLVDGAHPAVAEEADEAVLAADDVADRGHVAGV